MGEYLHQQGYSVLGVRLAGHATRPADMVRSRWTDWAASVEDGYHLLCGYADRIYLIGLSMGGVLSLLMSTRLAVRGVIAISTPCFMPRNYPAWLLRFLSWFKTYQPKGDKAPDAGWVDKDAFREHVSYPQNPTRSAAELRILIDEMRAALPRVRVPVLLIHSKDDAYIAPENMEHIYSRLINTAQKTKLYVTGSGHVVTRDAARQPVFEASVDFISHLESV